MLRIPFFSSSPGSSSTPYLPAGQQGGEGEQLVAGHSGRHGERLDPLLGQALGQVGDRGGRGDQQAVIQEKGPFDHAEMDLAALAEQLVEDAG